jgi:hypothetical protein
MNTQVATYLVAGPSDRAVYGRSPADIVISNPAGCMGAGLL